MEQTRKLHVEVEYLVTSFAKGEIKTVEFYKYLFDIFADNMLFDARIFHLATTADNGAINVRPIVVSGIKEAALLIISNRNSRKIREISKNPGATLSYYNQYAEFGIVMKGGIKINQESEWAKHFWGKHDDEYKSSFQRKQSIVCDTFEDALKQYQTHSSLKELQEGSEQTYALLEFFPKEVEIILARPKNQHKRIFLRLTQDENWELKYLST